MSFFHLKKIAFLLVAGFFLQAVQAQSIEIGKDKEGHKMLKGLVTKQDLAGDTAFGWFTKNAADYKPYAAALQNIKKNKDSVDYIVFGGTWCHDTHFVLPRFFSLLDSAGVAPSHITFFAVDESKKANNNLPQAFNITNVPTIIVLKRGKEVGRVIEYGKQGMFDKELGEIVKQEF
ncbi:thioredoxin family protein [Paraflavisolibacter sp. H34]|uniref:thioredoxin family protein n=1 Tax=Huijunlia imazamoxiresistens TaxID=3127457 RepID=UPI0030178C27